MSANLGFKKETRRAVYDYIRESGPVTKNSIAIALTLSLPTVNKYIAHFIEAGLVAPGKKVPAGSQGGRSPISYRCLPDGRFAVGVDVTHDSVTCLIVNLERQVVHRHTAARVFERSEHYFAWVGSVVADAVSEAGIDPARILGVGVAVPGLISETTESVTYGRVLNNEGVSVSDFSAHLPYRTRLVHDSDAAGLAEFWPDDAYGSAFYVSLSRSVGGSILINGEIFRGDGEFAGEIGHVRIHTDGELCYCGQRGCMDAYCNAGVLARNADGTLEGFFARLATGDPELERVWDRYTDNLARSIHNIRVLFGCSVILGGDVGAHIGPQMPGLHAKVDRLSFLASNSTTFLYPCNYQDNPVATGAALYLVDEFRQELGPPQPRPTYAGL